MSTVQSIRTKDVSLRRVKSTHIDYSGVKIKVIIRTLKEFVNMNCQFNDV